MGARWGAVRAGSADATVSGELTGKSALVTGGRQGIGRAIVNRFVAEGAKVTTCGRGLRPLDLPQEVRWEQADVSKTTHVQRMGSNTPTLNILVNNAGVQIEKTVLQTSDDDWDAVMGTNAKGPFLMCREFIPRMTDGGSIINIGSISGNHADANMALYNASKAFVHGLTRAIALDHGAQIRCNAICPGWIMTDMADAAFAVSINPHAAETDALARHPVGRFGKPEDVAAMAVWLASDQSAFANGQLFTIDGGMTAASPVRPDLSIR